MFSFRRRCVRLINDINYFVVKFQFDLHKTEPSKYSRHIHPRRKEIENCFWFNVANRHRKHQLLDDLWLFLENGTERSEFIKIITVFLLCVLSASVCVLCFVSFERNARIYSLDLIPHEFGWLSSSVIHVNDLQIRNFFFINFFLIIRD